MHSLRTKLFAFLVILLLILLLLINWLPLTSSRDLVFEEKNSSLSGKATVIASSLSLLDSLNPDSVGEVLRLLDVSGITRTVISDQTGKILYDNAAGSAPEYYEEAAETALSRRTFFRSRFSDSAFSSCFAMPIYNQRGSTSGVLYLFEYDADKAELLLTVQGRIRNLSLVISAGALILSLIFMRGILRRIGELVRSMRIVAGGDYSHRLVTRGNDELTELGNEFNALTEHLDENERQRRRFVSDASHELKTPLASIRLLSDSIVQNEGMDSDTVREFVSDIGNEANRLQRTTEKLLDLSRLDDNIQIVPEPVDIKQVADDAAQVLQPLADEKQVEIDFELDDGCVVMATADDIFHIVFNLMENAVKYNVPGGTVTVQLNQDDENVHFSVSDTGIGIPEEDLLNIFARFYRVDKARSREAGGSGLGLSIVHDAVLAHGGTISVGQNKPRGSVFIVTFPRPTPEETGI